MEILSTTGPKAHKARLSKNRKKKSWRKFSNVADVEDFLDEQRDDARTGGPVYEKKDSELFLIDDIQPLVKTTSANARTPVPGKSSVSEISLWKGLKCFTGLSAGRGPEKAERHSHVSRAVNSKKLKRSVEILNQRRIEAKRQLDKKAAAAAQDLIEAAAVKKRGVDPVFNRNLWSSEQTPGAKIDTRQAAITKSVGLPPTLRAKKISGVRAIEIPHAGTSYNPAEADHADLVARAAAHAVKEAVAEAKLDVFSARRTMSGKTAAETWMEEMDAGLPNATLKPEEEILIKRESDLDSDDDDIQGAVGKERKPQKIRKREKLESAKTLKRSELKKKRIRENEVYSIKKIMKEIKVKDGQNLRKALLRKAKVDDPARVKKLGRVKFVEPDITVKLKEDIADNLRLLKPEGSLFTDRYKSLQRRNIVEPRNKQRIKRKYKLKQYQIEGRKQEEA